MTDAGTLYARQDSDTGTGTATGTDTGTPTGTGTGTGTATATDTGTSNTTGTSAATSGTSQSSSSSASQSTSTETRTVMARRRRDDFDGNFDPDRVTGDNRGTLPDIDLGAADQIEPYSYHPPSVGMPTPQPTGMPPAGPGPGPGMPDMRQYGGQVPSFLAGGLAGAGAGAAMANASKDHRAASPPSAYTQPSQSYYAPSSSDHGYPDYSAYAAYANQYPMQGGPHSASPPSSPTNTSSFGAQQGMGVPGRDFRHPSPGPSLAPTTHTSQTDPSVSGSSASPGVIPSAKEREAMQYRRQVANPDGGAGASGPSGVVQHQDAGRLDATPEDEEPSEVPPRYDSIRHDP
ncbi:hypothetical protein C8Q70DRAFT_638913 [Cubamyces menziesii]|nr:hypothetical protein C8Q70DRAFT_638913 [Cubamyces menziesii]